MSWQVSQPAMCADLDAAEFSVCPLGRANESATPLAMFEASSEPPLWQTRHDAVTEADASPVRRSIELVAM